MGVFFVQISELAIDRKAVRIKTARSNVKRRVKSVGLVTTLDIFAIDTSRPRAGGKEILTTSANGGLCAVRYKTRRRVNP